MASVMVCHFNRGATGQARHLQWGVSLERL
jgi:hypothetical protein